MDGEFGAGQTLEIRDGDRLALHAFKRVQAAVQRASLAGSAQLLMRGRTLILQQLRFDIAQRAFTLLAQVIVSLGAGEMSLIGSARVDQRGPYSSRSNSA